MTGLQNVLISGSEIALIAVWLASMLTYPLFIGSLVGRAERISPAPVRSVLSRMSLLARIVGVVNIVLFLVVQLYPSFSASTLSTLFGSLSFDLVLVLMFLVYPVLSEWIVIPSFRKYSVISAYREKNPEGKSFVHESVLEHRMFSSTTVSAIVALALIFVFTYFY